MVTYFQSSVQVVILGFLAFSGPGLFNAMNGLGSAASGDDWASAVANGSLYMTFAVVAFFGAIPYKVARPILCLGFGVSTYAIYAICMFFSANGVGVVLFGAITCGIGAGVFWVTQTALMLGYATQNEIGRFVGIFWGVFNLGGMLGGILQTSLSWNQFLPENGGIYSTLGHSANQMTYWTFIVFILCGSSMAFFVAARPEKVIRSDGSNVDIGEMDTVRNEFGRAFTTWRDPFMLKMGFFFFYSNWYYTFHFNAMTGAYLNTRAGGINICLYRVMNIVGAQLFGILSDRHSWSIKKRARLLFGLNCFLFYLSWILGFATLYTTCNGRADKDLGTFDPAGQAERTLDNLDVYQHIDGVWEIDKSNPPQAMSVLTNSLAWFPGDQISKVDGRVVADGCEWLKETRSHFRGLVSADFTDADGKLDQRAARHACFNLTDGAYDLDLMNANCLWDLVQCIDTTQEGYGNGLMDITFNENSPLCDLTQLDLCTTFGAHYKEAILPIIANIIMGLQDAFMQCYAYWIIAICSQGTVSQLIRYSSGYKGIQSFGASLAWVCDLYPELLFRYQAIINVILGTISLIGASLVLPDIEELTASPERSAMSSQAPFIALPLIEEEGSDESLEVGGPPPPDAHAHWRTP